MAKTEIKWIIGIHGNWKKIKILGALFELNSTANPAHLPQNRAKLAKTAPRILIFSIAMDADNSFYVKFIATEAPTFFGYIISVLASVCGPIMKYGWVKIDPSS